MALSNAASGAQEPEVVTFDTDSGQLSLERNPGESALRLPLKINESAVGAVDVLGLIVDDLRSAGVCWRADGKSADVVKADGVQNTESIRLQAEADGVTMLVYGHQGAAPSRQLLKTAARVAGVFSSMKDILS